MQASKKGRNIMEKKKFEVTRGKIIAAVVILVAIICAVYFFMPRNAGSIAGCNDNITAISISDFRGGYNDTANEFIKLEGEAADQFLEKLNSTKVFISPIHTKLGEGGAVTVSKYITFDIEGGKRPHSIYVFTDKILIIDGRQYTVYGSSFTSYFLEIVNG